MHRQRTDAFNPNFTRYYDGHSVVLHTHSLPCNYMLPDHAAAAQMAPSTWSSNGWLSPCEVSDSIDVSPRTTSLGHIPAVVGSGIESSCSRLAVTPSLLLLAALRAFVFRYTDNDDVVFLVSDATENVDHVLLRCHDDCYGTFEQLVGAMSSKLTLASQVSTEKRGVTAAAAWKAPPDVAFRYLTTEASTAECAQHLGPRHDFNGLQLKLDVMKRADGSYALTLEYLQASFRLVAMDRFLDNLVTFVANCVGTAGQPIMELGMCSLSELEALRSSFWNVDHRLDPWSDQTVCQRIVAQANRSPSKVAAVASDGTSITYHHLLTRAQSIAGHLRWLDLSSSDKVCLLIEPGVESVAGMLGILMAGCCYIALDSHFAPERLAFILSDCAAKCVLFESKLRALAQQTIAKSEHKPNLVDIADASNSGSLTEWFPSRAEDPFYMIYTSGSTGVPKGVVLSHKNTQQMLASMEQYFGFSSDDHFLQQSSLAFDLSVVQIFSALASGGQICIAARELRNDPAGLASFMQSSGITVTYITPTQFALLLECNPRALQQCSRWRVAMFAGERLSVRLVKAFHENGIHGQMYNTWSPSEVVVQTAIHKVEPPHEGQTNVPIGFPLPNCRHYIVDSALNPLPRGLVGEICVGGAQVGMGYLNRPDATQASFVRDPFCSKEDIHKGWARLFRTGDKGRFLPNGLLEFHGRIAGDKQIKLRGFRIDLGEVEQVLYQHSQGDGGRRVVDISIVARRLDGADDDLTDDRGIIAFVALSAPLETATARSEYAALLHERARPHLNAYMLPTGYQFLDRMPVTVGEKIDRRSLLHMQLDLTYPSPPAANGRRAVQPNGSHHEMQDFLDLVGKVLGGGRRVAPSDNFFAVGGQSISLLRLHKRLRKKYAVQLELQDMFRAATLADMAAQVDQMRRGKEERHQSGDADIIDWVTETALPSRVKERCSRPMASIPRCHRERILIAGCDTYIGLHLLASVLAQQPEVVVYTLGTLRPVDSSSLAKDLARYRLLSDASSVEQLSLRTRSVAGAMTEKRLGLDEASFVELANSVQAIYNAAADVSLLRGYSDLKPANTEGVKALIELATSNTQGYMCEIHHLSTWSMLHMQTWESTRGSRAAIGTREESLKHFSPAPTNEHGYLKSRWAAEIILTAAAEHGVPVTIYRASAVSGCLATGIAAPALDFTASMVMHMIRYRSVPLQDLPPAVMEHPNLDFVIDFVPVDTLVDAMLALSTTPEQGSTRSSPAFYHLGSSTPLRVLDLPPLIPAIRGSEGSEHGEAVSTSEWLRRVSHGAEEQEQLYWTVVEEYLQHGHVMFALEHEQTDAALRRAASDRRGRQAIFFPPIDAAFLQRLWTQSRYYEHT